MNEIYIPMNLLQKVHNPFPTVFPDCYCKQLRFDVRVWFQERGIDYIEASNCVNPSLIIHDDTLRLEFKLTWL